MLNRLIDRIFYDPYRFVAKHNHAITVGQSILDKSFRVRFDAPRNDRAVSIGDSSILRCHLIFESNTGEVIIGNRVFINASTNIISRSRVTIEDDVTIAWGCTIYDHDSHSLDYRDRVRDQETQMRDWNSPNNMRNKNWDVVATKPITIKKHAWLGFDVVVLKGVTIGEGAVIGARSVVAHDIPAYTVAVGNPARVVRKIQT